MRRHTLAWIGALLVTTPAASWACVNQMMESRHSALNDALDVMFAFGLLAPVVSFALMALFGAASRFWRAELMRHLSRVCLWLSFWLFWTGFFVTAISYMIASIGAAAAVIASLVFGLAWLGKVHLTKTRRPTDRHVAGVMCVLMLAHFALSLTVWTTSVEDSMKGLEVGFEEGSEVVF